MWKVKTLCDSDFGGDQENRISVTGFCIYIIDCVVSYKSHGQKNVTLLSTKVQYVAIIELCCEILFVKSVSDFYE